MSQADIFRLPEAGWLPLGKAGGQRQIELYIFLSREPIPEFEQSTPPTETQLDDRVKAMDKEVSGLQTPNGIRLTSKGSAIVRWLPLNFTK